MLGAPDEAPDESAPAPVAAAGTGVEEADPVPFVAEAAVEDPRYLPTEEADAEAAIVLGVACTAVGIHPGALVAVRGFDETPTEEEEEEEEEAAPSVGASTKGFAKMMTLSSLRPAGRGKSVLRLLCGWTPVAMRSMLFSTSIPPTRRPKTVCLSSRWGVGAKVTKNWEPLVPGPLFAMLPRRVGGRGEGRKKGTK